MNIMENGDRRVIGIIRKKIKADREYRLSEYAASFSENGIHLLHSTLTGMTLCLSDTEWACAEEAKIRPVSGASLLEAGLEELGPACLVAETDTDEFLRYRLAVSVLKTMSREGKGTKSYTILPTTGCNARCVYCYEEGMPVRTMTEETADRTVEFIDKTRWQDEIKLIWFGGEPLAANRIISRICQKLTDKEILFSSKLVTNGTLMTKELLDEAVTLWRLKTAQVSVDGKRADYEARKRYLNPEKHHYDAMMHAVAGMLEKGIRVIFRCNYDGENLNGFRTFLDEVKARFGCPENLTVYPAMLFQTQKDESCISLYRKTQDLCAYIRELGLSRPEEEKKPFKLKINLCGADSGDKCTIIDPDGILYRCEHLPGNTECGSIFDPLPEVRSDDRASLPVREECRRCPFLPECTPFFRNGCPDWFAYCREFKQIDTDEKMHLLLHKLSSPKQGCAEQMDPLPQ